MPPLVHWRKRPLITSPVNSTSSSAAEVSVQVCWGVLIPRGTHQRREPEGAASTLPLCCLTTDLVFLNLGHYILRPSCFPALPRTSLACLTIDDSCSLPACLAQTNRPRRAATGHMLAHTIYLRIFPFFIWCDELKAELNVCGCSRQDIY